MTGLTVLFVVLPVGLTLGLTKDRQSRWGLSPGLTRSVRRGESQCDVSSQRPASLTPRDPENNPRAALLRAERRPEPCRPRCRKDPDQCRAAASRRNIFGPIRNVADLARTMTRPSRRRRPFSLPLRTRSTPGGGGRSGGSRPPLTRPGSRRPSAACGGRSFCETASRKRRRSILAPSDRPERPPIGRSTYARRASGDTISLVAGSAALRKSGALDSRLLVLRRALAARRDRGQLSLGRAAGEIRGFHSGDSGQRRTC